MALAVTAHQKGDVPGRQGLLAQQDLAAGGTIQQAHRLIATGDQHLRVIVAGLDTRLALAPWGKPPLHGRRRLARFQQGLRIGPPGGLHRMKGDGLIIDKWGLGPCKQAIDRRHQGCGERQLVSRV